MKKWICKTCMPSCTFTGDHEPEWCPYEADWVCRWQETDIDELESDRQRLETELINIKRVISAMPDWIVKLASIKQEGESNDPA